MKKYINSESVYIEKSRFIYRVTHKILEGDCKAEHGPIICEVGPLNADIYPVTNKMYYDFLKESGYEPKNNAGFLRHFINGIYRDGDENKPVVNINYDDAKAYAEFYNKRLPTDIEWQFLASGEKGLRFPWGNEFNKDYCNGDSEALTDVDAYPKGASPFGLFDMCGNAFEMTDIYKDESDPFLLLRGGSYYCGESPWHAQGGAMRNNSHLKMLLLGGAMNRSSTVSFRCVKDVKEAK